MRRAKAWAADVLMCWDCLRFRFNPKHIRYCDNRRRKG